MRRRRRDVLGSGPFTVMPVLVAGSGRATAAESGAWFEEVTAEAGIDFEHVRANPVRYWFPEIMSGGAAWCDVDGDDWLDLYLVQGGELQPSSAAPPGNRLYRNLGNGRFADVTQSLADDEVIGAVGEHLKAQPNQLAGGEEQGVMQFVQALAKAQPAWRVVIDGDRRLPRE